MKHHLFLYVCKIPNDNKLQRASAISGSYNIVGICGCPFGGHIIDLCNDVSFKQMAINANAVIAATGCARSLKLIIIGDLANIWE